MGAFKYLVVEAFNDYRRGDEIVDDQIIASIQGTDMESKVRRLLNNDIAKKEG